MTTTPSPRGRGGIAAGALALVAGLTLSACRGDERAFLAYPPLGPSTQALVVATLDGDVLVEVVALEDPEAIERALPSSARTFALLTYDRPLAALGLAPGPIAATLSGRSRALPTPRETFVATVEPGGPLGGWARAAEVPAPLAALRIAPDDRCSTLAVAGYAPLPGAGNVAAVERLDARTVRIINNDASARRIDVDGVDTLIPVTFTSSLSIPFAPNCSARAAREQWLGGANGVWAARFEDDALFVREIVAGGAVGNVQAIAVDPERPDDEAWVLTIAGELSRVSRGQRTPVYAFPPRREPASSADIIWLGPDHVLATHGTSSAIVELRAGIPRLEEPFRPVVALGTLYRTPDGTLLVGGEDGRFARRSPGEAWVELGDSRLQTGLSVIQPTADGFLFGADYGWVGEYRDGEFCELPQRPIHGFDVEHIVPLDGRRYAVTGRPDMRANGLTFVELR